MPQLTATRIAERLAARRASRGMRRRRAARCASETNALGSIEPATARAAYAATARGHDSLKKKWKNLKDGYRKELKKVPMLRSGDEGSDYKSQWKYFEQLSFLKDEYLPTVGETNLIDEDTSTQDLTEELSSSLFESPPPPPPPSVSPVPSTPTSPPQQPPTPQSSGLQVQINATTSRENETQNSSRKRLKTTEIRAEYLEIERKKLKLLEADLAVGKEKDIPSLAVAYHRKSQRPPRLSPHRAPHRQKLCPGRNGDANCGATCGAESVARHAAATGGAVCE
ncbi:unnamed protein product [Spodoptera exigua]|nr:unnamed protein product [Spodoptera exigua]